MKSTWSTWSTWSTGVGLVIRILIALALAMIATVLIDALVW